MTIAQTLAPPAQSRPSRPRAVNTRPSLDPLRAFRALRRLIADKEDTEQVFEIFRALSGASFAKGYRRMLEGPEGGRQAYLGVEFADRLHDEAWLASLPPGSVGAAYSAFIKERAISAYGLAAESRKVDDVDIDAPHPMAWYSRRLRDVHDVWHVLTGYNTDALGEACIVAFSWPQTGNFGFGFIAGGAALEFAKLPGDQPHTRALLQAWRHGRKAAWLPALDYEALFAEPLAAARQRLNIAPPTIYDSIPAPSRNISFSDA